MVRCLLRLTPAFIICSAANAQTPPVVPDVPGAPPSDHDVIIPKPDSSGQRPRPPIKFKMPDGFGGLKEDPSSMDSAPDQTGSTRNPDGSDEQR
jgi:hypothetical protein